jgi:hypothetical protein
VTVSFSKRTLLHGVSFTLYFCVSVIFIDMNRVFLKKLAVAQLVKNFPTFFRTCDHNSLTLDPIPSKMNPVQPTSSKPILNSHFNTILSSTGTSIRLYNYYAFISFFHPCENIYLLLCDCKLILSLAALPKPFPVFASGNDREKAESISAVVSFS